MRGWSDTQIATVVNAGANEGQSLEFKAELPAASDRGKAEFLKDVSSFANADGGTILYGISEKAGHADSLSGLKIENPDKEVLRLSQIIQSGIEPKLTGINFGHHVIGESHVLAIDIPQSFDAPHRYSFNGHSKFVQRIGTHVSELSFDQLRSAFLRTEGRLTNVRKAWLRDFGLQDTWRPMSLDPICVLRVSTLLSADERQIIDPQEAHSKWERLILSDWGGGSPFYNYEGLVVAPGSSDDAIGAYAQVHRVGAVTYFMRCGREWNNEKIFVPGIAERCIMEALPKAQHFLISQNLRGGALLHIGITNLADRKFIYTDSGFEASATASIDKIVLPEIYLSDLADDIDEHQILRPGFDLVWQAYGRPRCANYRPDGIWHLR